MAVIRTIESHCAGEPLRIIVEGWPEVEGETMLERRAFAKQHQDHLRTALMLEPRGHSDMYGAIPMRPATPDGDLGVLFLHNEGFSTMCGHGIIALVTAMLENQLLQPKEEYKIDTPAGRVVATARFELGRVRAVAFRNVASFLQEAAEIDVPGIGRVPYELAFGGAYYAYVDAEQAGVTLRRQDYRAVIEAGMKIKRALMSARTFPHPEDAGLGYLYGVILSSPAFSPGVHLRNVCVFADGQVDRSPTGTGVSGRVAIEHARGRLRIGEPFVVEGILGLRFTGRVLEETKAGEFAAVVPSVEGRAWVTGRAEFQVDPEDPVGEGFLLA